MFTKLVLGCSLPVFATCACMGGHTFSEYVILLVPLLLGVASHQIIAANVCILVCECVDSYRCAHVFLCVTSFFLCDSFAPCFVL